MAAETEFDYIIVGQGLAGTSIAECMIQAGQRVLVIDQFNPRSASHVAAGIFNPVTGRRLVLTWLADLLFPEAHHFYTSLEQKLETTFYYQAPIYRPFSHPDEKNEWLKKSTATHIAPYINQHMDDSDFEPTVHNLLGGITFAQGGYVKVATLIDTYRTYLINEGSLMSEDFDYSQLVYTADAVFYKNIQAKGIIFCEGYRNIHNPYFNHLPLTCTKGETIDIQCELPPVVLSKGVYVVPAETNTYKVGATYDWDNMTETTTTAGLKELLEKLDLLIKPSYTYTNHTAGVRPTVKDRRPLIGFSKTSSRIAIFNGLGTKGVLLAPFFAKQFVSHILHQTTLHPEVRIERFEQ